MQKSSRQRWITFLAVISTLILAGLACSATDVIGDELAEVEVWFVSVEGDDSNDCQREESACRTIEAALDKAGEGGGVIQILPGIYEESGLNLNSPLTVIGEGSGRTIVQGVPGNTTFIVNAYGEGQVVLDQLTLQGGDAALEVQGNVPTHLRNAEVRETSGPCAILNEADLSLRKVVVRENESAGICSWGHGAITGVTGGRISDNSGGPGIWSQNSSVSVIDADISRNTGATIFEHEGAPSDFGLFLEGGTLSMQSSIVAYQETAGIWSQDEPTVEIIDSTFHDNLTGISGSTFSSNGQFNVINSTISSNSTGVSTKYNGDYSFYNVTLAENTDTGLYIDSGSRSVLLENTLLANNTNNCAFGGLLESNGYNISTDGSCLLEAEGDRIDVAVDIFPLDDNGGPTPTNMIWSPGGNPAIEGGNPDGCRDDSGNVLATDQRGVERPQGSRCDVGAYEYEISELSLESTDELEIATVTPSAEGSTVIDDGLCWRGPGDDYQVVSALSANTKVEVIGQGEQDGWWVIDNPDYPGVACWLDEDIIKLNPNLDIPDLTIYKVPPVPTSTPDEPDGGPQGCLWYEGNEEVCYPINQCPVDFEDSLGACNP